MNNTSTPANNSNVVALVGGVGGAKLAWGLTRVLPPDRLKLVVNTADDFEMVGLRISPDLDTVMYTLAGLANPQTGWGLQDETWNMLMMLAGYGMPTWFWLGDRDLATHLLRSLWLREGFTLTWATGELCRRLGVQHTLLPMTDAEVHTVILTDEGSLPFQEYFVRRRWQPAVKSIRFEGIESAQATHAVASALRTADVILLAPSNPFISIDPILALPGIRRMLTATRAPKVAISPIVAGQAIKGPAAKMMREMGLDVSPLTVARHYRDFLTGFVLDWQDETYSAPIADQLGMRTLVTNIVMQSDEERVELARQVLEFSWET
jgi:LPPG:FO 2-phospho-L-lactate transferase